VTNISALSVIWTLIDRLLILKFYF